MMSNRQLDDWMNGMKRLAKFTDEELATARRKVEQKCPYGTKYFCDGTVNKNAKRPASRNIEPCKYLVLGKCGLNLCNIK